MNHAKRVDANQGEIVKQARQHGLKVELTSMVGEGFPDLVVGGELPCPHCHVPFWQERLIEIKTPNGKLTPVQIDWWERWNGKASIARNWEEFAALVGLQRDTVVWQPDPSGEDADQKTSQVRRRKAAL